MLKKYALPTLQFCYIIYKAINNADNGLDVFDITLEFCKTIIAFLIKIKLLFKLNYLRINLGI